MAASVRSSPLSWKIPRPAIVLRSIGGSRWRGGQAARCSVANKCGFGRHDPATIPELHTIVAEQFDAAPAEHEIQTRTGRANVAINPVSRARASVRVAPAGAEPVKTRLAYVISVSNWAPLLPDKKELAKDWGTSYELEAVRY